MAITAADVMKLRKMTSAGMMDCKNALVEADGDFNKAIDIIREKGKLVAAKRADRNTSEGAVKARVNGNKAILVIPARCTVFLFSLDIVKKQNPQSKSQNITVNTIRQHSWG